MKKLFSFVAVLFCSVLMLEAGEKTVADVRTLQPLEFADKVYDGTTVVDLDPAKAQIELALSGVVAGDDVNVEVDVAQYDSKNAGDRTITLGLKLTGSDAEKYELSHTTLTAAAVIVPKTLVVDSSTVEIQIVRNEIDFPMDPKAVVIQGAVIDQTEVIEGDVVAIETSAQFYDLIPGTGKTVFAQYNLTGADAANYVLDRKEDIYSVNGEIYSAIDLEPFEDGKYFRFTGEDAEFGICPTTSGFANFKVKSGLVSAFSIHFSEAAKAAGFKDITEEALVEPNQIYFFVPEEIPCGKYTAEVCLSYHVDDDIVYHSAWLPLEFAVRVSATDIVAVYNDVVGLKDLANRFVSYQWYLNGTAIDGAIQWFYQQTTNLQGSYKAKITTAEGEEYFTCEREFVSESPKSAPVKAINAKGDIVITLPDGTKYDAQGNVIK